MEGSKDSDSAVVEHAMKNGGARQGRAVDRRRLAPQACTTGLYTYPDMTLICGSLAFAAADLETVVNPTLVAEVLSDSTEAYDRGAKFRQYIRIPTLREYLLVSQREPRIEQFIRRNDGPWLWREAAGLEATLEVPSLGIALPLSEVFANVDFPTAPASASNRPLR